MNLNTIILVVLVALVFFGMKKTPASTDTPTRNTQLPPAGGGSQDSGNNAATALIQQGIQTAGSIAHDLINAFSHSEANAPPDTGVSTI